MPDSDKFYLGRLFDSAGGETTADPLLYDPDDLTTHAVVVGMTGSGKTGLCIDLLEEAALQNLPALMIDPKGDITNMLLHFPELRPSDFEPWVNPDVARREGKTTAQLAEETADLWRNGLAKWEIGPERIQALQDGPRFTIYTPGSDAGRQVSILASLKAPALPWEGNKEVLREQISGTVTALLGLIGLQNLDPVQSREHILLANIFENAWSQGKDLTLGELIMQVQNPPFDKLGFFDVNTFFPEKDRFQLAMMLNNILAAPAFQTWIEGEPLDVARMLFGEDGRPRHTIFYIAHLPDAERMFFVTLLFSAVETWMRAQSGTTSLRALVYFDEIFGYLPPVGNPPSKEPMLRLLKQARAFGVGLVLATQNPVDVDYKALSNAGTWFIGKLGTEQDKQRLLDGLATAAAEGLDRREYDDLISALGKRVFLLRNVHEAHPLLFQTRWAMNYLAGPVTRAQIPALNALAGATEPPTAAATAVPGATQPPTGPAIAAPDAAPETAAALPGSATRPAVPGGVPEYFLANTLTLSEAARLDGRALPPEAQTAGILYRPVLLAQAEVRYLQRKYNLNYEKRHARLIHHPDRRGMVRWEDNVVAPLPREAIGRQPAPQARFAPLEAPLSDDRLLRSLEKDFADWIYRSAQVMVRANETLKVYAGPDVDAETFRKLCLEAAEAQENAEIDKLQAGYEKKLDRLQEKLTREERELREDEEELAQRKQEELSKYADTFLSIFSSRRRRSLSSALSKRRMTAQAKADVEESLAEIEAYKQEMAALQQEMEQALDEVEAKWLAIARDITKIPVTPYKKDIHVTHFGVAWFPFHLVQAGGEREELPGFRSEAA